MMKEVMITKGTLKIQFNTQKYNLQHLHTNNR